MRYSSISTAYRKILLRTFKTLLIRFDDNSADALNDANTVVQVVAYMHDRTRTRDSSGLSQASVVYPSP